MTSRREASTEVVEEESVEPAAEEEPLQSISLRTGLNYRIDSTHPPKAPSPASSHRVLRDYLDLVDE
jgi:hypothetical protein